jgi:hypothetical protein
VGVLLLFVSSSILFFTIFKFGEIELPFIIVSLILLSVLSLIHFVFKGISLNIALVSITSFSFYFAFLTQLSLMPIESKNVVNSKNYILDLKVNNDEDRVISYVENTLIAPHSAHETIATGLSTLGEYFRLMVFPNELSFYYGYSKIKTTNFMDWKVWSSLLIHMGLILLAIWKVRQQPLISLGFFWYIISILLFSNWPEFVAGMVGERLAFTASAGFSIFIAGVIYWLKPDFNLKKPRLVEFSVIVVLILFSIRTMSI